MRKDVKGSDRDLF